MPWYPHADGSTISHEGTEGLIVQDEEHSAGARITLEKALSEKTKKIVPFTITCGIYGVMFHTVFVSAEQAIETYERMRARLDEIISSEVTSEELYQLVEQFTLEFQ